MTTNNESGSGSAKNILRRKGSLLGRVAARVTGRSNQRLGGGNGTNAKNSTRSGNSRSNYNDRQR